jgi:hypothetical protein
MTKETVSAFPFQVSYCLQSCPRFLASLDILNAHLCDLLTRCAACPSDVVSANFLIKAPLAIAAGSALKTSKYANLCFTVFFAVFLIPFFELSPINCTSRIQHLINQQKLMGFDRFVEDPSAQSYPSRTLLVSPQPGIQKKD